VGWMLKEMAGCSARGCIVIVGQYAWEGILPTRHDGWKESCANGVSPRHWAWVFQVKGHAWIDTWACW
jgi:hypothetical protein